MILEWLFFCQKYSNVHSSGQPVKNLEVALRTVFNHETYLALRSYKLHTLTKYFVKT